MHNVWDYRDTMSDTGDITGYDVEAVDGSIGRVDAASNAVDNAHHPSPFLVDRDKEGYAAVFARGFLHRLDKTPVVCFG